MQILDLYKYEGEVDGRKSIVTSPCKIPGAEYVLMARLVADAGKVLTNNGGQTLATVIDVELYEIESWIETEMSQETGE